MPGDLRIKITSTLGQDTYAFMLKRYRLGLEAAVNNFLNTAVRYAPRRTGRSAQRMYLRRVVASDLVNTWQLVLSKPLFWTLTGTRPHIIRPKKAKVLRWEDAGGVHFAKFVRHPGTQPQDWMKRALRESNIPRFVIGVARELGEGGHGVGL